MTKKTNKEKKEKFKENPANPTDRWAWTRELVQDLLEEVLELRKRVEKLERL